MKEKTVLVTGASGYLGSWITREFLAAGWKVIGSVRDRNSAAKVRHLQELPEGLPGELELLEADLLSPGSFDAAAEGASVVVHAASPFAVGTVEDPEGELLRPAVEGTRNVLAAASRSSTVERVVLTSSVVAVHGDAADIRNSDRGYFSEEDWNHSSSLGHQPYNFSKVEAEREAWRLSEEAAWRLVVINPGFILGPSLSARSDGTSATLLRRLLSGEFARGVPALAFGVVDVREAARAHFEAAVRDNASGRHILVGTQASFLEMAQTVEHLYPGRHRVPQKEVPKPLLYLLAPKLDLSWKYIRRNVGIPLRYDNRKSKDALGIFYRPLEETLRDHRDQLLRDGLLSEDTSV